MVWCDEKLNHISKRGSCVCTRASEGEFFFEKNPHVANRWIDAIQSMESVGRLQKIFSWL